MTSELAVIDHGQALAIDADQTYWTSSQVATLRQLGLDKASEGDLTVYHHVCQRTGLDPFARQIHMIGRNSRENVDGQWQWTTKFTIQTGIDGFRLIARRASDRLRETLEYEDALWCGQDGQWVDAWTNAGPPSAAKVTVLRHGKRFPAVALYREYVQLKGGDNPGPTSMWAKMPANQLAKCAEALALRRAFPQDLSGIYADEEMGQADTQRHEAPGANQGSAADRMRTVLHAEQVPDEDAVDDMAPDPEEPSKSANQGSPLLVAASPIAKAMHATFNEAGITQREKRLLYTSDVLGREVASSKELTEADASRVIDALKADLEQPFPSEPPTEQP